MYHYPVHYGEGDDMEKRRQLELKMKSLEGDMVDLSIALKTERAKLNEELRKKREMDTQNQFGPMTIPDPQSIRLGIHYSQCPMSQFNEVQSAAPVQPVDPFCQIHGHFSRQNCGSAPSEYLNNYKSDSELRVHQAHPPPEVGRLVPISFINESPAHLSPEAYIKKLEEISSSWSNEFERMNSKLSTYQGNERIRERSPKGQEFADSKIPSLDEIKSGEIFKQAVLDLENIEDFIKNTVTKSVNLELN